MPLHFKLTIRKFCAGTHYSGWQIQKNATTVQGEIDRAVRDITGRRDFELYGSGRTDAGVHALGQVAHLDVSTGLTPDALLVRLNDELPDSINIVAAEVVPHRFHARHHAVGRRYLYQIARRRPAVAVRPFVWWVKEPIDPERMRSAAPALLGMRDFRSFSAGRTRDEGDGAPASTIVLLEELGVAEHGGLVLVGVEGSHFLWKMVRRIVKGARRGRAGGELSPSAIARLLSAPSEAPARLTASNIGSVSRTGVL